MSAQPQPASTSPRQNLSQQSHSHNLSINSVSSITEPTTPPAGSMATKLCLWDSGKLNGNLVLPLFSLDSRPLQELQHVRQASMESYGSFSDKENQRPLLVAGFGSTAPKIDKEYISSISKVPLSSLRNDILRLAKDQHGCRFLQKRVDENFVPNPQLRTSNFEIIFEQVQGLLYELIIDPFGNYLIQKLIDYCNESNLDLCLETLNSNLFLISINQHGTRALQKIIDKMNNNYQLSLLIKGLKPYVIELIKDLNGNHVIQKVLNKYSPENCQFIYDSIIEDLLVVATHKHGCCVLQKCLNHVNASQHSAFSTVILAYDTFTRLVNDQFGNYVLQYLISIDLLEVSERLYKNFLSFGIIELCELKFSSNVIEKLMKSCYVNEVKDSAFSVLKFDIIHQILSSGIDKLINDPYGNYVVQTLIDTLINPNVVYFVHSPSGQQALMPSLQLLLDENFDSNPEPLQVQIIKKWFDNCKIVSSFGKRIQLKINLILNGLKKSHSKRSIQDFPYYQVNQYQSMNANGEFYRSTQPSDVPRLSAFRYSGIETQLPQNYASGYGHEQSYQKDDFCAARLRKHRAANYNFEHPAVTDRRQWGHQPDLASASQYTSAYSGLGSQKANAYLSRGNAQVFKPSASHNITASHRYGTNESPYTTLGARNTFGSFGHYTTPYASGNRAPAAQDPSVMSSGTYTGLFSVPQQSDNSARPQSWHWAA